MKEFVAKALPTLAAVAFLAAGPAGASGKIIAPGDQAPDTRGRDHNNVLHVIDFSAAEFTLVNFWATWCEPCRNEMPALQQAHEDFGPRGLRVVGITHELIEDEDLAGFLDEMGVTYTVFRAGLSVKRGWIGVKGSLPNSYLIGRDGRVIRRYVGALPEQIEGLMNDLVAVLEGRPLGMMIFPGQDAVATPEDRVRQKKEDEARNQAGKPD
ncbi:MAG: TlpA disulfide reductase family protein, partial [Gemmatimonadales bacterium]